ncbi:MAG: 2-C-methyl-D-erythritol 2,4-cyclodiphosphate synthase, partial [Bacteroidales bacterium]|nr:2-C-methyl-D-erythritol 2,4-cyclodiphosphate synthase [Bacteroidales bacterium]
AAGLQDIGHYFPDTDNAYKDIDSKIILAKTFDLIRKEKFSVVNIDSTLCLERPKIAPYISDMKKKIADILSVEPSAISVKATTTEKMGFVGRGEGVAAFAVALLERD